METGLYNIFYHKKEALSAEKRYKKYPLKSLVAVINSEKNIVPHYLKGIENRWSRHCVGIRGFESLSLRWMAF